MGLYLLSLKLNDMVSSFFFILKIDFKITFIIVQKKIYYIATSYKLENQPDVKKNVFAILIHEYYFLM